VTHVTSGEVLMVAHMNAQALALTVETGLAHFWSRSRKSLWKKGESSGHMLGVRDIRIDCDQDAVWVLAEPAGPTCHTGARSCFFRRIGPDGLSAVDEPGVDAAH
jgi:phosphoribosyl-AMP cyclohydrolase